MRKWDNRVGSVHRIISGAARWAADVLIVLMLAWFFVLYMGYRVEVDGRSMEPLMKNQDIVLTDKVCYNFRDVKRFEVIAFRKPDHAEKISVKRVVALPGETVQIRNGDIYINGQKLDTEGRIRTAAVAGRAEETITLGEDEYFVMGDWPEVSEDSRFDSVGNVHREQIIGRVWFRLEPFSSFGPIGE